MAAANGKDRAEAPKRVYIRTFGCQMNEYDTQKLYRILEPDYSAAPSAEEADLVLINTCSVRDKPEHKLYSLLGEMKELKTQRPALMVGVGGCVAQQEGQRIVKRSSAVDFVFGTQNLSLVPALIKRRAAGAGPQVAVNFREEWEELPLGFAEADLSNRTSAFISVSRGCNKNCTYCIVPTTRGPEASRAADEILREVRVAVKRGAREIVLLGQTVNSWGLDLAPRRKFSELLNLIAEIEGVERIRFTSPHPQEVREDFFDLIQNNDKICRHIHMPLQSGSDRILKLMNRNYRRKRYLGIIHELKTRVPEIAITTDIIVGFPGESERDFEATLEVIKIVEFDSSYSFAFSPRPGTVAAAMEDDVPREEKLRRLQVLQLLQDQITTRRLNQWVGREVDVLLDGPSAFDSTLFQGRSSQNLMVNLLTHDPRLRAGMTVKARVREASRFTLRAELTV
ncbi:MAG: tRNA (N6-isopentenyl adenosine(37)-C2)-methylthiotransferase MiaB [Oligoflexia bacterium]|nr:tRNA (N6-isopentenyl adenosine(37)-C2)-methylthiotransferase MiaB [Oligoflexia bacterium]